jgi:hypothetical protein
VINKCKPTTLNRPPKFDCELKPPVCFNNMTFSDMSVFRKTDNKLMHVIKPGGYAYMYEGIENDPAELNKIVEEDEKEHESDLKITKAKEASPSSIEQGPVKLNKYVWQFEDDGNVIYESIPNYFYSITVDNKFMPSEEESEKSQDEESINDFTRDETVKIRFEANKFNVFIYTPYVIINQTDIPLYFGEKGKKKNECLLVQPNQNEFFTPKNQKQKKFSIFTDNYEWADPFDISTLGMSGEAVLKRAKEYDETDPVIRKYNSNEVKFGVLISTLSHPYGKTLSVKFVPRYMFVNNSNRPVIFAQEEKDGKFVNPGESVTYYFESKKKQNIKIKVREPKQSEVDDSTILSYQEIESTDWSSKFAVDDCEDFQISVK